MTYLSHDVHDSLGRCTCALQWLTQRFEAGTQLKGRANAFTCFPMDVRAHVHLRLFRRRLERMSSELEVSFGGTREGGQ